MSARCGDKARFNRARKRRAIKRAALRNLRVNLAVVEPVPST